MEQAQVLHGHIIDAPERHSLRCRAGHYLVFEQGRIAGVFPELPSRWEGCPVSRTEGLILPGLTDLHVHAPQYAFAGSGMDLPLLPWLESYTFPEEIRYADLDYAAAAYERFVRDLRASFTGRAVIFATCHSPASRLLRDKLAGSGLAAYVGRVSMDQYAPDGLREGPDAASQAEDWLREALGDGCGRVLPIVTPRFIPSCSPSLLTALSRIAAELDLPIQSHLSENRDEQALVSALYPEASCYAAVYDDFGLLGERTVLAHCVHCSQVELDLLAERGCFIAHCPQSNINLMSGAAPIRSYLEQGLRVGLGTDVAGGAHLSLFRAIQDAVAVSKLRCALLDEAQPLSLAEAFYLATRGGGSFFGPVGLLEADYVADALIIDDSSLTPESFSLEQRVQRAIYLLDERAIQGKYVEGQLIFSTADIQGVKP